MSNRLSVGHHSFWKRGLSIAVAASLVFAPSQGSQGLVRASEGPPAVGGVSVASDPAGATVYVDGKFSGQTPLSLNGLSAGDHRPRAPYGRRDAVGRDRAVSGRVSPDDTRGVIDIAIGVAVSWGITASARWSTRVSLVAVLLAFVVSSAVGLVFDLYPAIKAARLEPVEALHCE